MDGTAANTSSDGDALSRLTQRLENVERKLGICSVSTQQNVLSHMNASEIESPQSAVRGGESHSETCVPGQEDFVEGSGDASLETEATPWSGVLKLEDLRSMQALFARERQWDHFHTPRNLLLALVGEVGEVSELFQWKGEVASGLPSLSEKEKEDVGDELSDVLLYLVRLADVCSIDLEEAVLRKYKKNSAKYPVDKCKGSSRKYTAYS